MSASDTSVDTVLRHGSLTLEGRLIGASNASFYGHTELDGVTVPCIYKPIAGERPLWDFPEGSLAGRECAARLVSDVAGWQVVPPTVLREGRFGPGMVQQWIESASESELVDVVPADADEQDWLVVLEAQDASGDPVLLVHADDPRLRSMAVYDVVINNADRKGGHVLLDDNGRLWGCDHGVSFHEEGKLRTVLWGWSEQPLREEDVQALRRVAAALDGELRDELTQWLSPAELYALEKRIGGLLGSGIMPVPDGSWPAIPWPPF